MTAALAVVADDVTGGVMIAGYLEEAGIHAPVVLDPAAVAGIARAPVTIAAGRLRTVPAGEATAGFDRFADALAAAGCRRLAYKACATFDSTEAGNIGPVADRLAARSGVRPVLMSAGLPEFGTTVHQGYLFYRGRLVTESIKRLDPLTPMPDPDLVRFLGRQTPHSVGLVAHAVLRRGVADADAEVSRLAAQGAGHVLLDASDDDDVEVSADVAVLRGAPVVASDPLIVALARRLVGSPPPPAPPPPAFVGGPAAVIAGSVGPVVTAQLAAFGALHPVLVVDLSAGDDEAALVGAALDRARPHVGERPFAVTTAAGPEEVARLQARLSPTGAARRAEAVLAAIAAGLAEAGVRRLVVAGGETSGAVAAALGVGSLRSRPRGPLGTGFCVSAGVRPMSLYLKPGKLGADDVLLAALDHMRP